MQYVKIIPINVGKFAWFYRYNNIILNFIPIFNNNNSINMLKILSFALKNNFYTDKFVIMYRYNNPL